MIYKETAVNATVGTIFYHVKLKNADGTPLRARVNGKCKTWKNRPDDFKLPMKYGLKGYFYIESDAHYPHPGHPGQWVETEVQVIVERP